jgi:hypothetical protein
VDAMRVGASPRTSFIVDDVRQAAEWPVERARAAWEAELDSLLVGDKQVMARPTTRTRRSSGDCWRSGATGRSERCTSCPLWNPVLVAEQVGTLASLASRPDRHYMLTAQSPRPKASDHPHIM